MEKWYESEIGQGILKSKYYHPDEKTPEEFMDRVTSIFSPAIKDKMRKYIENASVCPAGRTLYAAGAKGKFKGSLSNCYILPSPTDDIESIFQTNEEKKAFAKAQESDDQFDLAKALLGAQWDDFIEAGGQISLLFLLLDDAADEVHETDSEGNPTTL
mgnify:CR=1 FL=1